MIKNRVCDLLWCKYNNNLFVFGYWSLPRMPPVVLARGTFSNNTPNSIPQIQFKFKK
jgi:hypothetical protein